MSGSCRRRSCMRGSFWRGPWRDRATTSNLRRSTSRSSPRAEQSVLFQPVTSAGNPGQRFAAIAAAETQEFQQQDLKAAESAYRRLAESSDPNARINSRSARLLSFSKKKTTGQTRNFDSDILREAFIEYF